MAAGAVGGDGVVCVWEQRRVGAAGGPGVSDALARALVLAEQGRAYWRDEGDEADDYAEVITRWALRQFWAEVVQAAWAQGGQHGAFAGASE